MKVHHPSPSAGHHHHHHHGGLGVIGGGGGNGGSHVVGHHAAVHPLSHHQLAAAAAAGHHADPLSAAAMAAAGPPPPPGPPSGYPQLMDMYSAAAAAGMSPTTAINTMDWKNTSQVRAERKRERGREEGGRRVFLTDGVACEIANSCMNGVPSRCHLLLLLRPHVPIVGVANEARQKRTEALRALFIRLLTLLKRGGTAAVAALSDFDRRSD